MQLMRRNKILALGAMFAMVLISACGDDDPVQPVRPPTPANFNTAATSATSVRITFDAVTNASSYVVQRAPGGAGDFVTVGSPNTNTFDDTGLQPNTAYRYRIAAVRGTETSAFSQERTVTTLQAGRVDVTIDGATPIAANRTLYADTVYILKGFVKVSPNVTLTIQPGTKIVGDTNTVGSSLYVLRGARLVANGTAQNPIVFTSQRVSPNRKPGDWGGIVIVGRGIINRTANPILTEGPAGVSENYAGGTDNNDNSGSLRYVRIEFAGYDVSSGNGQELNSLSMYAVGKGTTLEYVQSVAGLDDSFEWWGGAVDGRYLVSYESGDDHFDWTESYRGRNQFLIAYQSTRIAPRTGSGVLGSDPRGFEGDGCDPAVAGCTLSTTGASEPFSLPVFANFTAIGANGLAGFPADGNGLVVRRGSAGVFVNGVIARYPGRAISIRDAFTDSLRIRDSLYIGNIVLAENGANYDPDGSNFGQEAKFAANGMTAAAGAASTILTSLTAPNLDFTPVAGQPAASGGMATFSTRIAARVTNFFGTTPMPATSYRGAADPAGTNKWWQGWTVHITN
jgi:Fibronectin type III domain